MVQLLQKLKLINYSLYVGMGQENVGVDADEQNHDSGHDGQENDQNSSDSEDEYFANNNHTFKRGKIFEVFFGFLETLQDGLIKRV